MSIFLLFTCVAHAPDGLVAVVGEIQRSVFCHHHRHRTAPSVAIWRYESGDEILVHPAGMAIVQRHADNLIARARGAVPRSMLGAEQIPAIVLRELSAVVER